MTMRMMKNDQKKMSLDTVLSYFLYYMTAGCFTFVYPRMKNEEKSLQINHENKLDILLSNILVYRYVWMLMVCRHKIHRVSFH